MSYLPSLPTFSLLVAVLAYDIDGIIDERGSIHG